MKDVEVNGGEISNYENALSSSIGANEVYLTETSNRSILTAGAEIDIEEISLEKLSLKGKAFNFYISNTGGVAGFELYGNGNHVRMAFCHDFEIGLEEGTILECGGNEKLKNEEGIVDYDEVIFILSEEVCGENIIFL